MTKLIKKAKKAKNRKEIYEFNTENGSFIPKDKKKITFEHRPYIAVQDNTYVAPKIIPPFEKKQFNPREQPVLRADTRTERERKVAQEYTESVLNPSISRQIGEAFQKPLRWLADPVKGVGDIVSAIAPNSALAKDLPNTNEDELEYRKKQLNPYTSNKEKLNNTINEVTPLAIWALLNILPIGAVGGNMIKSGKNLIKPASKVVNKTDDVVKLVERKQVFDKETLGSIERYNKYFGKDIPNSPLTMTDRIKIGRDWATEKDLTRAYRNTHIDEVINARKQGYFNNNRFPETDWYYGGSASKYGNIEVEAIPDSKYFRLFENDGKYVGIVTPNKNILHLKGSNVPFKDVTIRYKGEVLTDDILEEISKQYKNGDNLDELLYSIKNKTKN